MSCLLAGYGCGRLITHIATVVNNQSIIAFYNNVQYPPTQYKKGKAKTTTRGGRAGSRAEGRLKQEAEAARQLSLLGFKNPTAFSACLPCSPCRACLLPACLPSFSCTCTCRQEEGVCSQDSFLGAKDWCAVTRAGEWRMLLSLSPRLTTTRQECPSLSHTLLARRPDLP